MDCHKYIDKDLGHFPWHGAYGIIIPLAYGVTSYILTLHFKIWGGEHSVASAPGFEHYLYKDILTTSVPDPYVTSDSVSGKFMTNARYLFLVGRNHPFLLLCLTLDIFGSPEESIWTLIF